MVAYTQFLALLLLPKQYHALLSPPLSVRSLNNRPSSPASALSFSKPIIRKSSVFNNNINPFDVRCNNYHSQARHQNQVSSRHVRFPPSLYSSTSSDTIIDHDSNDDSSGSVPLSVAMAVGVVTSLVGFLYSKCMKSGFNLLWNTIPSALFGGSGNVRLCKLLHQYPAAYIVLIMTLGGGLVATLSTLYFPNLFSAHDYVHILSKEDGADMEKFPSTKKHLLPVMLLSLLTSISGFSLGPEAPMVSNECIEY